MDVCWVCANAMQCPRSGYVLLCAPREFKDAVFCVQVLVEAAEQGAFSYKDSGISVMGTRVDRT